MEGLPTDRWTDGQTDDRQVDGRTDGRQTGDLTFSSDELKRRWMLATSMIWQNAIMWPS